MNVSVFLDFNIETVGDVLSLLFSIDDSVNLSLAEMFGYSTDLRSKTQGRGNYSMFFEKYEPVPKSVQEKVLADKSK